MAVRVRSAAIYARISSDQDGKGLGVARQVEDCTAAAESAGWTVGETYVDNDISAYGGKVRPAYQRMLADLRDGLRDGVVCYHVDRLTRRPMELEEFITVLDGAGVRHVRFVTGEVDLGTGDGLLIGRIMAAVAANESAAKSRRVKRKMLANAEAGLPHGPMRPFGYQADRVTIDKAEAKVLRAVAARYVAGESLRSLCVWLDAQGVATVTGGSWKSPSLRGVLAAGRIAGMREHQGVVIGPAVWKPIISLDTREKILARMQNAAVTGKRTPRRYLLSGLLRCDHCGGKLYSAARTAANGTKARRYVCSAGPDHRGCGRLTVVAAPVEDLITTAVLVRLDSTDLADVLAGRAAADADADALSSALGAERDRLEELAGMFGQGEITAVEWRAARDPIDARIRSGERALAAATHTDALAGLPGQGASLRRQWDTLDLTRQAAIISAVMDHAVITAGVPGARGLDPDRVHPIWRH